MVGAVTCRRSAVVEVILMVAGETCRHSAVVEVEVGTSYVLEVVYSSEKVGEEMCRRKVVEVEMHKCKACGHRLLHW